MHPEGQEVHETTDEARAGSTTGVVRWVLAISLLAALVLLSAIWMTGAASTDEEDRVANQTDRVMNATDGGDSTDSIVSDEPGLVAGPDAPNDPAAPADAAEPTAPMPAETPE